MTINYSCNTMFSAGKKVIKQDGLKKLQFKTNKRTDFIYTEKLHKNTNIMLEKTIQNV